MSEVNQTNVQTVNPTERTFDNVNAFGILPHPVTDTTRVAIPPELVKYLPRDTKKKFLIVQRCKNKMVYQELSDDWHISMIKVAAKLKLTFAPSQRDSNNHYYVIDKNVDNAGVIFGDEFTEWKITTWQVVADTTRGFFVDTINWEALNKKNSPATFSSSHEWRIY